MVNVQREGSNSGFEDHLLFSMDRSRCLFFFFFPGAEPCFSCLGCKLTNSAIQDPLSDVSHIYANNKTILELAIYKSLWGGVCKLPDFHLLSNFYLFSFIFKKIPWCKRYIVTVLRKKRAKYIIKYFLYIYILHKGILFLLFI